MRIRPLFNDGFFISHVFLEGVHELPFRSSAWRHPLEGIITAR